MVQKSPIVCLSMHHGHQTILHVIRERAADTPDDDAIIFEPSQGPMQQGTYSDLWRRANEVANQVRATGKRGDRVVLLFSSGLELVAAFLGCLLAGRVAVPAAIPRNTRAAERTVAIIRDAGARVVLTSGSLSPKVEAQFHGVRFDPDPVPVLMSLKNEGSGSFDDRIECGPDDIAFLQYTSGSTANPKGVVVGHDNLSDNLRHIYYKFGFDKPATTFVNWLPAHHDMGLIGGILEPLYSGSPTVLMSPSEFIQRPVKWLELITKHKGTISGAPNFAYDACVSRVTDRQLEGLDLSTWRVAFNGSEPVRPDTLDRFAAKFARCGFRAEALFPCYGLAEATLMVTCKGGVVSSPRVTLDRSLLREDRVAEVSDGERGRTLVSCGAANEDHELVVVNPSTKQLCSEDEIGELWLSGPSVCRGYWNRDEENHSTFSAVLEGAPEKRFLRTGDLGIMREGQLYISGRLKNIVIIRGFNYVCEDIEDLAQASHHTVATAPAAAFGVEHSAGEELVIVQEINRAHISDFDREQVTAAIQESIVLQYGIRASEVVLVQPGTLPRTTSGKLQRPRARDAYLAGKLSLVSEPESSGLYSAPGRKRAQG